jgi:hypothetical protein
MKTDFYIPVKVTENITVNCKELKNKDYINILKYSQNQDYKNLSIFLEDFLKNNLSSQDEYKKLHLIDKVIILLTIRSVCVSSEITLESKKLNKIVKKINLIQTINDLTRISFKSSIKLSDNLCLNLNIPKKLSFASFDDILENSIYSLTENNKEKILTFNEIKELLNILPGNLFFEIKSYITQLENYLNTIVLIEKDENFNLTGINCSIHNNTLFNFLLSVFSDSLLNFYQLIYIFNTKLHTSKANFDELTPAESNLMINLYVQEQEEIEKASKKQSTPLGKNVDK